MDVLTGMRTYAAIVTTGSFTAAAERLGISKALTSKYLGQLEEHLGVRLLNRTTRKLNMTEAGQAYYSRCRQLLDELDELEAAIRDQQEAPQGKLVISAPTTFGEARLTRAIAEYLDQHPRVVIELLLADRYVSLVDEGFDLAIRIGNLADSSLIARRLTSTPIILCAAPGYLAQAGTPQHPAELQSHHCIIDTNFDSPENWPFHVDGKRVSIKINGQFRVNNALAAREMALAGQGIALCPGYVLEKDLKAGRLTALLDHYNPLDYGIYAVYPHNRHLAAKVRSFVDFLIRHFE